MCMKKHLTKHQVFAYRKRVLFDASELGVSCAARRYGIHRDTIYEWRKDIVPRKPGPKARVSWQTGREVEELVLQLRLATGYGPKRLKDELTDLGVSVGEKAIRGIIESADLIRHQRKPRKMPTHPFYAPYPGYRIQVDTKAVPNGGDKRRSNKQQFTAIDIVSKVRYLAVYDSLSNGNSIAFVQDALSFYEGIGITVECIQTDNHATFTNLVLGGNKKVDHERRRVHPFTLHLTSKGIEHKLSRPGTPKHNGFVERSHRTDEEEFYRVNRVDQLGLDELRAKLTNWQDEYNLTRRHSACNNLPPIEYLMTAWQGSLSHA